MTSNYNLAADWGLVPGIFGWNFRRATGSFFKSDEILFQKADPGEAFQAVSFLLVPSDADHIGWGREKGFPDRV